MTDAADDFEALFDEIAAQRKQTETVFEPTAVKAGSPLSAEEPAGSETDNMIEEHVDEQVSKQMYERLGGIVRLLHDSLRELGYDRSLSNVAVQINDAQDRLGYIASLTEQAANKVLNAVDGGMPEQEALAKKAKEMDDRWTLLFAGKLSIEEFKALAGDSKQFAAAVMESTDAEKARLLEIMMAQDFQDLTGQVCRKIEGITERIENQLLKLLIDTAPEDYRVKHEVMLEGPQVVAGRTDAVASQSEVDDLLGSLGF